MKIAHCADLHYCEKHLKWVDKAMKHFVETAISEGCQLAIVAGDSFERAIAAHEPAFATWLMRMVQLANHMDVVVLQGTQSHDRPGTLDVLKALQVGYSVTVADTVKATTIAGVRVCTLPSLNKADPEVMATGANAWTAATLAAMGCNDARDHGVPSILVTHGTVTGCTTESGYAMVAPDHEFSLENLAAADCDAVMLGHIHRHQSWHDVLTPSGARSTIAYPGSLARLVHGHLEPVGFLIWDVEPGSADFRFVGSPSRQLVQVDFPGPPDMDELYAISETVGPDDAVRIRWTVDAEHATQIDKAAIRAMFSGADSIQIEPTVLPIQRVRADGIGKAMTLPDKLALWAKTTGSEHALKDMTDRLEMMGRMESDAIVAGVVGGDACESK